MITRKPLLAAPKKLQCMLLQLQTYSFATNYQAGKYMYFAETRSHAYLSNRTDMMERNNHYEHENISMA